MQYTTILIDVDDTLLDFDKTAQETFITLFRQWGLPYSDAIYAVYVEINNALWRRYERGELTKQQVLETRFAALFSQMDIPADGLAFEQEFQPMLAMGHAEMAGATRLLQYLSQKYSIYAVTNGAGSQAIRLKSAGMDRYLRGVFASEQVGVGKPSRAFFDHCFAQIGEQCRPSTMIIGDSLTSDMRGGVNAGITTCWFNPHELPNPYEFTCDYEVKTLAEIEGIL